jgi:hypothetical protein
MYKFRIRAVQHEEWRNGTDWKQQQISQRKKKGGGTGNQQSDKNENAYDRDIFSDMWEGNQTKNKLLQKKRNNKKGRKYFGASNPLAV